MKKIYNYIQLSLLGLVAIVAVSCKQEKLSDVLSIQTNTPVNASLDTQLSIDSGSTYTLDGANLTIPVNITFSSATTTAFTINLASNVDTVANLITAGTLPATTVAFAPGGAAVATVVNVPTGVKSVSFNVIVSRSIMELNYGKNLAAVIKISNPSKGNKILSGKNAMILVVKTTKLLSPTSIHQVSFGTPTTILNVSLTSPYIVMGSDGFTYNIPVALQGDIGAEFSVDAVASPDSVTKYITKGTLPGSTVLASTQISLSTPTIKFLANSNSAILSFSTKILPLLQLQTASGVPSTVKPTIAFTLKNPTKYRIAPTLNTVYVVIDPNIFRPFTGTPFLIKGTVGAVSDPIYAANYDFGGEGIAYHDDATKSGDASWRPLDFVDVSPDYTPRSDVGTIADNEWLTFSINVETTGSYKMENYFGASNSNGKYTVFVDNVLITPSQLATTTTGPDNRNQQPYAFTIPTLTKGYHILKVFFNKAQYDYRQVVFTKL